MGRKSSQTSGEALLSEAPFFQSQLAIPAMTTFFRRLGEKRGLFKNWWLRAGLPEFLRSGHFNLAWSQMSWCCSKLGMEKILQWGVGFSKGAHNAGRGVLSNAGQQINVQHHLFPANN
jgi:hypothetical protein